MKNSRKQAEIQDLKWVVNEVLDVYLERRAGNVDGSTGGRPAFDPAVLWKVRLLLKEITTGDNDERFVESLNMLARNVDSMRGVLVLWIDLIEVLVRAAEERYPAKGRGPLKSSEVKSVVLYLLRTRRFKLPNVPDYLEPVVIDVGVGWTVDAICTLANQHGLFIDMKRHRSARSLLLEPVHLLVRLTRPIWLPVARLLARIWLAMRFRAPISPTIRQGLAKLEDEGLLAKHEGFIDDVVGLKRWVGDNAEALHAGVQLISLLVEQAELVAHLDGPGKKAYAHDLAIEVLREVGVSPRWTESVVTGVIIDVAIDLMVQLFNKWGVFSHQDAPRTTEAQLTRVARPDGGSPTRPSPRSGQPRRSPPVTGAARGTGGR